MAVTKPDARKETTVPIELTQRPHKWPGMPKDGNPEVIAWKCAACGQWVSEIGPIVPDDCPIDWRGQQEGGAGDA